jgi:sugar phosphate permease
MPITLETTTVTITVGVATCFQGAGVATTEATAVAWTWVREKGSTLGEIRVDHPQATCLNR